MINRTAPIIPSGSQIALDIAPEFDILTPLASPTITPRRSPAEGGAGQARGNRKVETDGPRRVRTIGAGRQRAMKEGRRRWLLQ